MQQRRYFKPSTTRGEEPGCTPLYPDLAPMGRSTSASCASPAFWSQEMNRVAGSPSESWWEDLSAKTSNAVWRRTYAGTERQRVPDGPVPRRLWTRGARGTAGETSERGGRDSEAGRASGSRNGEDTAWRSQSGRPSSKATCSTVPSFASEPAPLRDASPRPDGCALTRGHASHGSASLSWCPELQGSSWGCDTQLHVQLGETVTIPICLIKPRAVKLVSDRSGQPRMRVNKAS